ncbi:hypothetical protein LNQ52_01555 [Klebsiella pneumoniae subsp. pneumoniae]|nr:hypothetical protein [Klebsiella pneumoniae subsp. pneumoniae]
MVVIALISAAIWYFFGPAPQIVYTLVIATTVLIIACPCALGWRRQCQLSPALAGRRSMACWCTMPMRCSAPVRTRHLVFDKTGTLTEGKPQVVAVKTSLALMSIPRCVLPPRWSRAQAVRWRRAILDKAADGPLPEVSGFPHPARPWRQRRGGRSSSAAR